MGNRANWVGVIAVIAVVLAMTACSSNDATIASSTEQVTTTVPATLHILVTNDDGVGAPGIDAVVEALRALPDTEVTVVAPLENQSGSGGRTTPGTLTVTDTTTESGYPAKAVAGFPADSVNWALDQAGVSQEPDLVVSGINFGQNLGPAVAISGTVGAAEAAAARGVPALAASQGLADVPDYPSGVDEVLSWLELHRADLLQGVLPASVTNLNVPTCPTGTVRGVVEEPVAPDAGDRNALVVDCSSTQTDFVDDIDAFINGYAVLSDVAA
jgi:5'/3'-nucleotidase